MTGNSVYGHTIMRKDKHATIEIVGLVKASKLLSDPLMTEFQEIDDTTFEVNLMSIVFLVAMMHHLFKQSIFPGDSQEEAYYTRSPDTAWILRV